MSHLISGVDIEGPLVFHMTPPQIVKPRIKRFLKSTVMEGYFDRKSQSKIIDHVCKRYSRIEQDKLKVEQQMFISNKCSTIKKKFTSAFNPKASGKTVQNFFNKENMTIQEQVHHFNMNLKGLSEKMPKRVDLQKKYSSNINIKMMAIHEADIITKQKQQYKNWLNELNNRINSPNLNKMAFLLQRMSKRKNKQKTKLNTQNYEPQDKNQADLLPFTYQKSKNQDNFLKQSKAHKVYSRRTRTRILHTSQQGIRNRFSSSDTELYKL